MSFKKLKSQILSLRIKAVMWAISLPMVHTLVLKVLPKIRFSTGYGLVEYAAFNAIATKAEPGDLIFSVDNSKLTSILIPGKWSHVGIVVDNGINGPKIVEAVPPAVRSTTLFDFCRTADEVMLMRPGLDLKSKYWACTVAKMRLGTAYDAEFTIGPKALYCAELIADAYYVAENMGMTFDWSDLLGLGYPYLTPDGVADGKPMSVVYSLLAGK